MQHPKDDTNIQQYVQQIQANKGDIEESANILYQHVTPIIIREIRFQNTSLTQSDVTDIAADTWIAIWEKIQEYDPSKAQFTTWASVIARRKTIDYLRKESRSYPAGNITDIQHMIGCTDRSVDTPIHAALNKELRSDIAGAITKLPEPDRSLYLLYLAFDITYAELANLASNILGEPLTEKAVQNRMYRTRKKLFEILKDEN